MSEKGMKILHKINLFLDLKQIDLDFCEHCVYGKQKRGIFLKVGKEKKSERLQFVHTYVWGPTQGSFLGGYRYYVTFIDDATIKVGFIAFNKNMMFLILLRNGNLWLRMGQEKS